MKFPSVKLSPYERAINRLNDLPLALDKVFSEALEDLRRQRDEARKERDDYKSKLEAQGTGMMVLDMILGRPKDGLIEAVKRIQSEREDALNLAYIGEHRFPDLTWKARCEETVSDLREARDQVERLIQELAMALQVSGELCNNCGWAMKFPDELCRCELEKDIAKERATSERYKEALEQVLIDINNPHPRMGSLEGIRDALKSTERMVQRAFAGSELNHE